MTVKATINTIKGTSGNDSLTGTSGIDVIYGYAGNDTLYGYAGNDTLDGGAGADSMIGGKGNDTYYVDNTGDTVTEKSGQGFDIVVSSISYTLGANIEELILAADSTAANAVGNDDNNYLEGNSQDNVIDGKGGKDTMYGGDGNDTYFVDNKHDTIVEFESEGIDLVRSCVSYTLADNVENLLLTGTSKLSGTGNDLDNVITGNDAANKLYGGDGNDSLAGGAGDDILYGGDGNDTLDGGWGADTMYGGDGNDTYVVLYGDSIDYIRGEDADGGIDTVISYANCYVLRYSRARENIENLILVGNASEGYGNSLDNVITGNDTQRNYIQGDEGNDTLYGGSLDDTLYGGTGNDTYYVDNTNDMVIENANEGTDTVYISVAQNPKSPELVANVENLILTGGVTTGYGNELDNYITGNSAANTLYGLDGNDTLDGGAGADTMAGSIGNDTYYVDNTGDVVTENSGEGSDLVKSTITYTLGNYVENLTLIGSSAITGTGTAFDNYITGNSAANTLYGLAGSDTLYGGDGNDTLDGGAGNDSMEGGAGADSMDGGAGNDTLYGGAGADTMYGGAGNDTLDGGTGADSMDGGAGNDTLNGGPGADSMVGGAGKDVYYVDDAGDVITENSGEDRDQVVSSISYTLPDNVEELFLTGSGDSLIGTGNSLNNDIACYTGDNKLYGLAGNDVLYGGAGNDTLYGGTGNDTLYGDDGADTYAFSAGDGSDMVMDRGTIAFDSTVGKSTVAFFKNGIDLIIGYGSSDTDTIDVVNELYDNPGTRDVKTVQLSNGQYLTEIELLCVVTAVNMFAANVGISLTSVNDVKNNAEMMAIISSAWHS